MQLTVASKGMDEVAAKMAFLKSLGSVVTGIALHGASRKGGQTSADIIEHLAEADTPRDIRPTEDDSDEAARQYMVVVEDRLRKLQGKGFVAGKNLQATVMAAQASAAKMATGAQSAALRAAGKALTNIMRERVSGGTTNDGSSAAPVTEAYAAWREKRFGVPASEVFKASGQLLAELIPANLRLTRT